LVEGHPGMTPQDPGVCSQIGAPRIRARRCPPCPRQRRESGRRGTSASGPQADFGPPSNPISGVPTQILVSQALHASGAGKTCPAAAP
jgi:hypothetical protein